MEEESWREKLEKDKPSHCAKCRFFRATVFEGETNNGWGSWEGYCQNECSGKSYVKSRFKGCDHSEFSDEWIKRFDLCKCNMCGEEKFFKDTFQVGNIILCSIDCAEEYNRAVRKKEKS